MNENKPYNCEDDYNEIMGMWNGLLEQARWIVADHEIYEMDKCIVELFYKAMVRTFRFLRLNRPENDDLYTKYDLGLYGAVTEYSLHFPKDYPSIKVIEAYFYMASIRATENLRRCFFDRNCLENSIVHADDPNDETHKEIEVSFDYDFENGDLLPIAKKLRSWDLRTSKAEIDWEMIYRKVLLERYPWETHQN